jgi:hypothetical protein
MSLALDVGARQTHIGEDMILEAAKVPKVRRTLPPLAGQCGEHQHSVKQR